MWKSVFKNDWEGEGVPGWESNSRIKSMSLFAKHQEQAGTGDMSLIPAKRLCESSQKVFKTAQLEQDLGESSLKVFKTAHIEQD